MIGYVCNGFIDSYKNSKFPGNIRFANVPGVICQSHRTLFLFDFLRKILGYYLLMLSPNLLFC